MLFGTLYVIATPIGNISDVSKRALEILSNVDIIACEDTRTTGRLLELLKVTSKPRLLAHHNHNEKASSSGIIDLLKEGKNVALVSDAGTPSINDPGALLVSQAHAENIDIRAIPGPSSVISALSVSGAFLGNGFKFLGFLPKDGASIANLFELGCLDVLVALETPKRLKETLEILDEIQPHRVLTLCRELTKIHEQVIRGTAGDVLKQIPANIRGEVVLVLDAIQDNKTADDVPENTLLLASEMSRLGVRKKDAARLASQYLGGSSRLVYEELINNLN